MRKGGEGILIEYEKTRPRIRKNKKEKWLISKEINWTDR